jgi:hypothetical protein
MMHATRCRPNSWSRLRTLLLDVERNDADAVQGELGAAGALGGAIPPGGTVTPPPALQSSVVLLTSAQVIKAALNKRLPQRLQHVLSVVEEAHRDLRLVKDLVTSATSLTVDTAVNAWTSHHPYTARLALLQLAACSGRGYTWLLDT